MGPLLHDEAMEIVADLEAAERLYYCLGSQEAWEKLEAERDALKAELADYKEAWEARHAYSPYFDPVKAFDADVRIRARRGEVKP
jgi:hypothetical protein